jgi:hypothetical protein
VRSTKRKTSRDEELDEVDCVVGKTTSQKIIFALSQCTIVEEYGSRDMLSRLLMHVDEQDTIDLVAQ